MQSFQQDVSPDAQSVDLALYWKSFRPDKGCALLELPKPVIVHNTFIWGRKVHLLSSYISQGNRRHVVIADIQISDLGISCSDPGQMFLELASAAQEG